MMFVAPNDRPVTTPDVTPTTAMPVFLLAHVPPASMSLSKVEVPRHMVVTPEMGSGVGFTVKDVTAVHPVAARV